MSENPIADGPDLVAGIPADRLADGEMLSGQVGDDSVLLARIGDEFHATDALCTHYSGPLAEGIITGGAVRCPWHHACFDLRTGAALRAPGMRPLRVFEVVRDGDVIRVMGPKQSPQIPRSAAATTEATHAVIIGAGAAGSFAAAELRSAGYPGRITLLSSDDTLPYDRPNLSKQYLTGEAPAEWLPLRGASDYASDDVAIRLNAKVEHLDVHRSEITLAGGETIRFDSAILATGAIPRRLSIPGDEQAHVHVLRTFADAESIRSAAKTARRAVVIGASFIGLEVAASLRQIGLEVTVVGMEQLPLERILGAELGTFIQRLHESRGVRFRLGRRPAEIRADHVLLEDGSMFRCDLVVVGVGVVLDLSLAEKAGLTVDRGVVVNEWLQTSAPNVWAAGDIARFPDARTGRSIRIEHWAAAARQGQTAARNLAGKREPFNAVPFFWSQHYDLVFAVVGHA